MLACCYAAQLTTQVQDLNSELDPPEVPYIPPPANLNSRLFSHQQHGEADGSD